MKNILKEQEKVYKEENLQSYKDISELTKNVNEYKQNEDAIVDICKIDINDIQDEYVKTSYIK